MELSNEDRRGLQRAGAAASEYNATMFAVEREYCLGGRG